MLVADAGCAPKNAAVNEPASAEKPLRATAVTAVLTLQLGLEAIAASAKVDLAVGVAGRR